MEREAVFVAIPGSYYEVVQALGSLYDEVDGCAFYEYLFPDNERRGDLKEDYSQPNAIYLYQSGDSGRYSEMKRRLRRRIMLADTWEDDFYEYVENNLLTLCSGLVYRNRYNRLQNAQRMNALVFDLDGVGEHELRNLLLRFGKPAEWIRTLPQPTFVVASGAGVHMYYVFETPVDLYPNIKLQLKALKYDLTFRMWEYKATSTRKEIQYQSINQTFRMVGSINGKYGNVLRAFRTGDKVTLDELNQYAKPDARVDVNKPFKPSQMTREQAKESYPEWYQRVVVEKRRRLKKWDIKSKQGYALYEWWLGRIGEVKGGHRYYFMMCLVIYACKCDVPRAKLEKDLYDVYEQLRRVEHENALTKEDIRSALETYSKEYYNFTITDIEKLTDIRIERNKRNGRSMKEHLQGDYWMENGRKRINVCKANRELALEEMRENGEIHGRPPVIGIVRDYLLEHPDASKADVIRGTGLSKPTVYKYYDQVKGGA